MTNKAMKKAKKWLKLALISTAGLTTLSAVPAMVCAKGTTNSNSVVSASEDPILKAASYIQIIFKLSPEDIAGGATITGKTVAKVKQGGYFGTIVKPIAKKAGWTFRGWLYNGSILPDTQKCNVSGEVVASFTQDKGDIVIKGNDVVSITDTATYTAQSLPPSTPQDVEWYAVDNPQTAQTDSTFASIDKDSGILTAKAFETAADAPVYVFAIPKGTTRPTTITVGSPNVIAVKLVHPSQDPKYSKFVITTNGLGKYFFVAKEQFTNAEGELMGTPLGGNTEQSLGAKTEFSQVVTMGAEITIIPNNFLADFTSFDNDVALTNVVNIGSNFLSDATAFNHAITLPDSLTYIGDFFMHGCKVFNNTVTFGSQIVHIGDDFMEECSEFAKPLVLPSTLTEIGEQFLFECNKFNSIEIHCPIYSFEESEGSFGGTVEHTITAKCSDKATFDALITLFPNKTGHISRKLVEGIPWKGQDACIKINGEYHFFSDLESSQICTDNASLPILDDDGNTEYPRNEFNYPIYLNPSVVTSIPDNFLFSCTAFDSAVSIPNSVTSIGDNFLSGCTSFNQKITISAHVTSVGESFLYNCDNMQSLVNVNCPADNFATSASTCATQNASAISYTQGIQINGDYAEAFMSKFTNSTTSPFRKLKTPVIPWSDKAACIIDTDGNFHYCSDLVSSNVSPIIDNVDKDIITNDKIYDRATFNERIYINPNITEIPANFLRNCMAFNRPLDLTHVTVIGNYFLYNDEWYILSAFDNVLTIPNVTTIGSSFLKCTSINHTIDMPKVQTIKGNFLQWCKAFNKPLTIPSSVETVEGGFLSNTDNMTSTITIECSIDAFEPDQYCFSTIDQTAPCYTQGIKISGLNASDWDDFHNEDYGMFPDKDTTPYRKLINQDQ